MKIITVNLPVTYIKTIDTMIGENGLYPSRSELIRVAVRDFLVRELESAQAFMKTAPVANTVTITSRPPIQQVDDDLFVRVPVSTELDGEMSFKTFRIVKK